MAASWLANVNLWHQSQRGIMRPVSLLRIRMPSSAFSAHRQVRFASYKDFRGRDAYFKIATFRSAVSNCLKAAWNYPRWKLLLLCAVGGVVYGYNIRETPILGRRCFDIPTAAIEKLLGYGLYQLELWTLKGQILPANHPNAEIVVEVVSRLVLSIKGQKDREWRVHVVDDPKTTDAMVVPGGKIFVYSGLLPLCKDQNGLAAVIAHEMAHDTSHHLTDIVSHVVLAFYIVRAVTFFLDISSWAVSHLLPLLFIIPRGKAQESEADQIGLMMMAESCFDPEAALEFLKRVDTKLGNKVPRWTFTHPNLHDRIKAITELMPEAKRKYESSQCGSTSVYYQQFIEARGKDGRPSVKIVAKEPVKAQPERNPSQKKHNNRNSSTQTSPQTTMTTFGEK